MFSKISLLFWKIRRVRSLRERRQSHSSRKEIAGLGVCDHGGRNGISKLSKEDRQGLPLNWTRGERR